MGFLSKLTVQTKIAIAIAGTVLVMSAFALIGLFQLSVIVQRYDYAVYMEISRLADYINSVIWVMVAMVIVLHILAVFLILWVIRAVKSSMAKLMSLMAEVANDNLEHPTIVPHEDDLVKLEIGDMVESISKMNKAMKAKKVMDLLDTMIYVTDSRYKLLYANKFVLDSYGMTEVNYEGLSCYKVFHNAKSRCSHCIFPQWLEDKGQEHAIHDKGYLFDYGHIWDEKLGKWLHGQVNIIEWTKGHWVQVHYCRDDTEKKLALDSQLEYERRLQEAAHVAEAASRAKSALIANTSHEIRTPMNSILGFSELTLDEDLTDKAREYLEKIIQNSHWLLKVVNNILDISKIESGKLEIEQLPFEVKDVLNYCQSAVSNEANIKGIKMLFYAEACANRRLIGDSSKLSQVLLNILSNAIKFTHNGIVKVSAITTQSDDETNTFTFEIRDSGIGMTEEQLKRIFEPFVQADDSITRKYGGAGLGLSIAKSLIEAMGGELGADSAPGIGSRFYFNLTFPVAPFSETPPQSIGAIMADIARPYFVAGEVLICEDNEMNQEVICEHLSRVGLSSQIAHNGLEAVHMIRERIMNKEKLYDLIFMDIHMPIMDGLEAASIISNWKTGVPMVALTANVISIAHDTYKDSGMEGYVSKPFTSQELWRCLLQYFIPNKTQESLEVEQLTEEDAFQLKMLTHFVKNNQDTYNKITEALESENLVLAHRLVHNLKSNAGNIQRIALQNAAAEVESLIRQKQPVDVHILILKDELGAVLLELAPLLQEKSPIKQNTQSLDISQIHSLVEEITPLLESGNVASLDYINDLMAITGSEDLVAHIENFDFAAALIELSKLKQTCYTTQNER